MNAAEAGRMFRITLEAIQVCLGPVVNASVSIDAVIQVHPGVVPIEHIPDAIIVTSALCLDCLGIAGPGRRVIGLGLSPGRWAVGHLGELASAPFLAPAYPL